MERILNPPAPILSAIQHCAAYRKWCLHAIIDDHLAAISFYREGKMTGTSAKDSYLRSEAIFNSLCRKLLSRDEGEAWDGLWTANPGQTPYESFCETMTSNLSSEHFGDCTSAACTCMRCWAEELYDLPSSATWRIKPPVNHEQ